MSVSWVIGSGGLLGKAVVQALTGRSELFVPPTRFAWRDEAALQAQMEQAVRTFAAQAAEAAGPWSIYWTAGIGTFASTPETMAQETRTLALFLDAVRRAPALRAARGAIVLASSAGAIYAGTRDYLITEHTPPAPTTAYAREKLVHEAMLAELAREFDSLGVFIGRISTIYGGGQASRKSQGLLTHIARCVLRGEPVHIYVPFDTIRDYINVQDVAQDLIDGAEAATASSGCTMRLVASEHPSTIAEIIGIFKRIAKRNPRVITSANVLSSLYARRIMFHSLAPLRGTVPARTPLLIGIAQLMADERLLLKLPRYADRTSP